jgi:hypothetical protein
MDEKDKLQQGSEQETGRLQSDIEGQHKVGEAQRDISEIDMQEGTMHNGALGGNFGEVAEETKKDQS